MKIGIIIQARMNSSRLSGKVLKKLAGKEVLLHVYERCKKSKLSQVVIIATSNQPSDDKIFQFCRAHQLPVFRGSLNNVLQRFFLCAKENNLDIIVRVTGDCPLLDALIIDNSIKLLLAKKVDYVSNSLNRVFPRGLDCEIFTIKVLSKTYTKAKTKYDQEHVTPYMVDHFRKIAYNVPKEYYGNYRLTLDEKSDLALLKKIFNLFYRHNDISVKRVIAYIRNQPDKYLSFNPVKQKFRDAIIVLGGGAKKNKKGIWETTTFNDRGDIHGVCGDKLRVIAADLLFKGNPDQLVIVSGSKGNLKKIAGVPPMAKIMQNELLALNVPADSIAVENKSGNTFQQLRAVIKVLRQHEIKNVKLISNKYHLPRIKTMMVVNKGLKQSFKSFKLEIIDAESVLLKHDRKKWQVIINKAYRSEVMKQRTKLEQQGVRQLKSGIYALK